MPTIQGSTVIAANDQNNNVLAGSAFEYLPMHANVRVALVGSAAGLTCTVQSGSDVLMEDSPISFANRFPVWPDDYALEDVAAAGDRLKLQARNTTAGALTLYWAARIDPII